jgi:hypothetical protein
MAYATHFGSLNSGFDARLRAFESWEDRVWSFEIPARALSSISMPNCLTELQHKANWKGTAFVRR